MIGTDAMGGTTGSKSNNVAVGYHAGRSMTTGGNNVALGYQAGNSLTTGSNNIIIGYDADASSATATNEITLGDASITALRIPGLQSGASDGDVLTFASGTGLITLQAAGGGGGASSLNGLSDVLIDGTSTYMVNIPSGLSGNPSDNTVIGNNAGEAITTGSRLTILGQNAGSSLTTSIRTVIIGHDAGQNITTNGWDSVHIGESAGKNVIGQRNTSVGREAMFKAFGTSDNSDCTAIGSVAFRALETGNQNTALGAKAGNLFRTGSNSTMIGYNAQASSTSASNEITLGDSNIATLRCAVTSITSLSDQRDKTDIKDISYGLDFIDSLQPREFVWDNRAETITEVDGDGNETEVEFYSANKGKKDFGFIAQEVQSVDDDTLRLVYGENPEKLELSYGKLVPILVQAIKELKAEVELLKNK